MPCCDHGVDSSHLRNPTITGGPKRSHVAANSQPSASSFQRHTLRFFIVKSPLDFLVGNARGSVSTSFKRLWGSPEDDLCCAEFFDRPAPPNRMQ